ncbi:Heteroproteinous nuclear ribonucleoprotein K [Clonorchis sinensis]|uniref:Heteroproteinous nuclear ribonucleoprotein K n=1 Tax=Clonorchis sinensis TaxID=79923 RepID=A0A8T1LUB9_CLOSI|nr:Heteroproteinous nuclear ribonucleoprotein K [Clonorchis sinensis]
MKRDNAGNGTDGPPSKFQRPAADVSNVVLRFLIPCRAAGIMIGKGGENIKKIRSQYNVKLNIPDNRGPERIMTIEGDLQAICNIMKDVSPKLKDIMNAKLSDPKRIMGHVPFKRRPRPGAESEEPEKEDEEDDSMLDYRILVHESQAGSVIGRGGERIKELRDKYRMRVIKVYQLLAPMSTDRVVQMVAEPENAIACLKSVVEAVESAPPRGRREDYDAANFCEADALNYGGFLSREALQALSQGMPIQRPMGMPPYMGGGPYQMGGPMGPGPMPGGMGPMGAGMGPMGGGRGPMGGGRGQMGGGRGTRPGGMMGTGGPRSTPGGPAPVPPPGGPRGGPPAPVGSTGGYGGPGAPYGGPGFDGAGGYDGSMYNADTPGQTGYGGQSFGGSGGAPAAGGYGGGSGYGTGLPAGLEIWLLRLEAHVVDRTAGTGQPLLACTMTPKSVNGMADGRNIIMHL